MNEEHKRDRFERWISSPPFERHDLERFPDDETKFAWPGNYKVYELQLAWESWLAGYAEGGQA